MSTAPKKLEVTASDMQNPCASYALARELGSPVLQGCIRVCTADLLLLFRAVVIPELRWAWPHASDMEEH